MAGQSKTLRYDADHPEFVPLSTAVTGHLLTGALFTPAVWLLWWLLSRLLGTQLGARRSFSASRRAVLVSAAAVTAGERTAVVAARHPAPGGWAYAIWGFLIPPVVGAAVGARTTPRTVLAGTLAMLLVFATEGVWLKNWQRGMSRTEVRQAWERMEAPGTEGPSADGSTTDPQR